MSYNRSIEAILFDFMGVLLFRRVDYQPNDLVDEIDQLIGGVTNDNVFKTEVMRKYELDNKEFEVVLGRIINKYEKYKPLWKLLPDLHKQYKLAIVNNGTALTLPKLKVRHQLDKNFDLFISSAVEGIRKPEREIFLLTAQRLGVSPQKCLFMDDSKINIEGASGIGMKTIWWQEREMGLKRFLEFIKA